MTESSFEECFREHFPRLVALGESMAGDTGVAQECAQEAFIVAVLPPRRRLIVNLFYGHDESITEIADTLGVSPNTVKSSLSKARSTLRDEMERRHVE